MRVINENQVNENYWSSSEKWILKNIHQTIENGGVSNYSLLDAGCGEGRLFTEFINYTSKIIGIEPDKQRYENALRCVRENHLENKVQVINASLENTHLQDKFDVVLSSHIIQHISTDHVETHLTKLAQATKDNGFLIINTNVSNRKDEYFIKGLIEEDAVKEPEITQKEFNELTSKTGQLPVHMFNRDKVCEYMLSIGFDLVDMKVFHVEKEAQNLYQDNTDQTVNDEPDLFRKYGRDICFIFRKRIHMQIIEEGALAEFCAFNIKLYGLKSHELSDRLKNFQLEKLMKIHL
jgi:2-polyprenyl-3-methyl-5-hydroxy-6-metoxy-1,4-benzoquinol methylase